MLHLFFIAGMEKETILRSQFAFYLSPINIDTH